MDARRFLTAASAGLCLGLAVAAPGASAGLRREIDPGSARMDPIPNPSAPTAGRERPAEGRSAIAAANLQARTRSSAADFVGGLQIFDYAPGRIYEVWAAPLRVTTLTLSPGETVLAKAAGDTVRWQIGETTSGTGEAQRTHVLLKPLEQGLETNLVLTTSRRVYLVQLRSGKPDAFNPAVTWDVADTRPPSVDVEVATPPPAAPEPLPVYGRYKVKPKGGRPHWSPSAVFHDGHRTYIAFPDTLAVGEAPALFALSPDGESQMVNYRQQGGLFVADRVIDRAELRLGGKRAQVVRLTRQEEDRP